MHEFQLGWRQTACNTYALRADDYSLKDVKSYSFRSGVRAAEKNHSSYIRRKTYSHLQSEPDSIRTNERPSASSYVSLTPPVRSCSCCSGPSPKPCCRWNDAHVRGDIWRTSPVAGNKKFHILLSLQWQWLFIYAWNCVQSPFFFFRIITPAAGIREAICSPVTLHYFKVSHYRVLRWLWFILTGGSNRWPFMHLTWTQW